MKLMSLSKSLKSLHLSIPPALNQCLITKQSLISQPIDLCKTNHTLPHPILANLASELGFILGSPDPGLSLMPGSFMTEEDLAELARATQELRLKQETPDPPEALRAVPSLSLQDIPKEPIRVPTEMGDINGVKVLKHDLFTNDVLYTEAVFNMNSLKQDLLPLVPLFCQSLLEMGTKDLTFVQLNQLIGRKTGGISVYPLTSSVRGKEDPCSHIIVRGKAMAGHAEDLFNLVNCVLQEVHFADQQRFKQFVSQSKARMETRLRGSGHGIAAARMDAKLNIAGWISEQMGGVSYLEFLQTLEEKVDQDWEGISSSLEEIRKSLPSRSGCLINMTAEGKNLTSAEKHQVASFIL